MRATLAFNGLTLATCYVSHVIIVHGKYRNNPTTALVPLPLKINLKIGWEETDQCFKKDQLFI